MKVLIIDDQRAILESLKMFFTERRYETITAEYGRDGIRKVASELPDIVILDIRLPDISGLEVLKKIKADHKSAFVIMVTAFHDMETTIEAMKNGAYDYIHKPISIRQLDTSVTKVTEAIKARNKLALTGPSHAGTERVGTIIGESTKMQELFKIIGLSCNSNATVLIQGESGTGKELIARAIHHNGLYRSEPFIGINGCALVETLLESELFGHEKGAFTNALSEKRGKIELAGNGTIFLDEVSELPLGTQVKLLRFLQEREFERVGGEKTMKSNARVIAATNKDLAASVKQGRFREDLFFRLNIIIINVPPLRERKSDIPLLVHFFIAKISRDLEREPKQIDKRALEKLMQYDWPGNAG